MTERRILIEVRDRTVAIEGGAIVEPAGRFDLVLRFPHGEVRPGLINAHDHLHRNHYGRLGEPPYADAEAWARDVERRHARAIEAGRVMPRREALLAGAWKNLFSGVTTVVHHDPWEAEFEGGFPLRVVSVPCTDSIESAPRSGIWSTHLAEGTTARSAREVDRLEAAGLLDRRLVAVHGVGLDAPAIDRFRASRAALVWCPSSNLFLYGKTAPAELLTEGIDVLLGSDSLLSGAGDLLDELRLARSLGLLNDRRLEGAVGATAARRLSLAAPALEPGSPADLIVLAKPLLEASAADVELVVVGGSPRVALPDAVGLLAAQGYSGHITTLNGLARWTSALQLELAVA